MNNDIVVAEEGYDSKHEDTYEYLRREIGYELNVVSETESVAVEEEEEEFEILLEE